MVRIGDTINMIPKAEIFLNNNYLPTDDATSDFVFDRHFRLNSFKSTEQLNYKLCHLSPHQSEGHKEVVHVTVEDRSFKNCIF